MSCSIDELTDNYIKAHNDLRVASVKNYHAASRSMIRFFGNIQADEVDHVAICEWRKCELDKGLKRRSWNTYCGHMRTMYQYFMDEDFLSLRRNPFKKASVIPPKKPKKTISKNAISQAWAILESMEREERITQHRTSITPAWFWRCVYETFYSTGLRLSALLSLRLQDIDLDQLLLTVQGEAEKTHREFVVPVSNGLEPFIRRICEAAKAIGFKQKDQLFNVNRFSIYYRGTVMTSDQVEAMYKKLTEAVGTRITPHRFRHTLASDLMKNPEANIHITQALLNHTNLSTTVGYIEIDYASIRVAINDREAGTRGGRPVGKTDLSHQRRSLELVRPSDAQSDGDIHLTKTSHPALPPPKPLPSPQIDVPGQRLPSRQDRVQFLDVGSARKWADSDQELRITDEEVMTATLMQEVEQWMLHQRPSSGTQKIQEAQPRGSGNRPLSEDRAIEIRRWQSRMRT